MSQILLTIFIYPIHKDIIDIMYWQNHTCGPPAQICKTDCKGKALLEGVLWNWNSWLLFL